MTKKKKIGQVIMMGNEAMARGLLEAGVQCATSYPGTPASEILEAVLRFKKQEHLSVFAEWAINEKIAFETALAQSYLGRRAAVSMKQVGLNVAADPLMSAAYIGVKGGFVIIAADDPGPKSSQTEQDSRFQAFFAKIPVFDPSSPLEAKEMVSQAFELSEKYALPVLLRPTTRVCHARQPVPLYPLPETDKKAFFERNPGRWAATPNFRYLLHRELNQKLQAIAKENPAPKNWVKKGGPSPLAIVASGVPYALAHDILLDAKMSGQVPLFKVDQPYPLPVEELKKFLKEYKTVLVLEETYPLIEMQLADGLKLLGRRDGSVPAEGELTPDHIHHLLARLLKWKIQGEPVSEPKGRRPSLCPGCPHRSAFWAIKKTFPKGIFPGDIGCYTLGMNMGVVDTCLCMGASIIHRHRIVSGIPGLRPSHTAHCGHHRRFHLFSCRDPGPGPGRPSKGQIYPGHSGQFHRGHDRGTTHSLFVDPFRRKSGPASRSGKNDSRLRSSLSRRNRPVRLSEDDPIIEEGRGLYSAGKWRGRGHYRPPPLSGLRKTSSIRRPLL